MFSFNTQNLFPAFSNMVCNPITWFCTLSEGFLAVSSLPDVFHSYCSYFMIPLLFFPPNFIFFSSLEETVSHF